MLERAEGREANRGGLTRGALLCRNAIALKGHEYTVGDDAHGLIGRGAFGTPREGRARWDAIAHLRADVERFGVEGRPARRGRFPGNALMHARLADADEVRNFLWGEIHSVS